MSDSLWLWNQVEKTNPNFTKRGSKSGYSFTSVNPQHTIKRATELWGACGEGWEINHKGQLVEASDTEKIWVEEVTIKYPGPESGEMCEVTQYGVATLTRMTKGENGYLRVDEEAPKKALTNGVSKALSLLGFSADLWLEYYDNPEYVSGLRQQAASDAEAAKFENMLTKLGNALMQTGATEGSEDEEYLCRFWSKSEYGAADAYENEQALRAILRGQSSVTSGSNGRERVPVAKQLEAARNYCEGES